MILTGMETEARKESRLLSHTARQLGEAQKILEGVEVAALSGVASVLCEVVDNLAQTVKDMVEARPSEWMTAQQAAAYLGFDSVEAFCKLATRENVPKHYLSTRVARYNRVEIDDWVSSRPRIPPCA